jgi:hypothetical protein
MTMMLSPSLANVVQAGRRPSRGCAPIASNSLICREAATIPIRRAEREDLHSRTIPPLRFSAPQSLKNAFIPKYLRLLRDRGNFCITGSFTVLA